jgi:ABC-type Fe3+-hydroxamate transport system substrate-binding protein
MRIVSLVPSITATIAELGHEASLVGCTTFCVDPPGLAKGITVVGGTKDPDIGKIRALAPDRILVNNEENRAQDIEACKSIAPVLESFPVTPADVPQMIRDIGHFIGASRANEVASETESALEALREVAKATRKTTPEFPRRFVYLIWRNPWMVAGTDTYISRFLELAGFQNAIEQPRYPQVDMSEIARARPDIIFFSSEPWPFRRRDSQAFTGEWENLRDPANAGAKIPLLLKIDGKALSWHGTETKRAATSLRLWLTGDTSSGIIRPAMPGGH